MLTATTDEGAPRRLRHEPTLDGLRAVAVLLVVLSHAWIDVGALNDVPVLNWFVKGSFLGVDVFFVLSGFLITSILLREQHDAGKVSLKDFYLRRAVRLLPALYVMLIVHVAYSVRRDYVNYFGDPARLHFSIRNALTYTSNWQAIDDPFSLGELGHLWSLAIEEQFYIIWPLTLVMLMRLLRSRRALTIVLAALIVLVTLHRLDVYVSDNWVAAYHGSTTRIDGLLIGALLAVLWVGRATPSRHLVAAGWVATAVATSVIVVGRGDKGFMYFGGFTLFNLAVATVVLALLESEWPGRRALGTVPMRAVGKVSYGIYLWHLPMIWVMRRWNGTMPAVLRLAIALAATAVFTTLSWFLVERPAQEWLRRWRRQRRHRRECAAPAEPDAEVRASRRRFTKVAAAAVLTSAVPFCYILWDGRLDPLRRGVPEGFFSNFFELQARAMAEFRWDVPRGSLEIEGFVVGGREYTYFPPFPSLLRFPVLAFTDRYDGRLTAPSILLAWCVTALFTSLVIWRVRQVVRSRVALGRAEALAYGLFLFTALGGSILLYIAAIPWVYHEPFAWGVAGSIGALHCLIGVIERPTRARVWMTGVMTLVAVWSRTTMGWGCVAAALLTAVWLLIKRTDRPPRALTLSVAMAGLVPFVAGAAVTYGKFGSLFMHPLAAQVWTTVNAQRRAALDANGGSLIGVQFLPSTLLTYLRPDGIRVIPLFPYATLPADPPPVRGIGDALFDQTYRTASITATMTLMVILTAIGIAVAFVRYRRAFAIPLLGAGMGCGGVLLYGYLGNRYVADFLPLLVVGGAVGLVTLASALDGRARWVRRTSVGAIAAFASIGVMSNVAIAYSTVRFQYGGQPLVDYIDRQRRWADATGVSLDHWVRRGERLPGTGPADELFVVGACDGLYVGTGETYDPWTAVELRRLTITVTPREGWTSTQRFQLARLAADPEMYVSVEGDGRGRLRVVLDIPWLLTEGPWIDAEPGRPVRVEVVPSTKYHYIQVLADGTVVGSIPSGNFDEHAFRIRATPSLVPAHDETTAPFTVTTSSSDTPLCNELLEEITGSVEADGRQALIGDVGWRR